MGNNKSIESMDVAKPLAAAWQLSQRTDYCDVLKNRDSGEEAELQVVTLYGSMRHEYERYDYRYHQEQNLVRVLNVQRLEPEYLCSRQQSLKIVTQRIPYLLADVQGLPVSQSLYILHQALIGFMAIHQFQKYITITDDMIGFTPNGRTKVWLNPNFAVNHPLPQSPDTLRLQQPQLAHLMISRILQIVQDHTYNKELPHQLNEMFNREQPNNFVQAINLVRDYWTESHARVASFVSVPTRTKSRSMVVEGQPTVTRTVTTETINMQPEQGVVVNRAPEMVRSYEAIEQGPVVHRQATPQLMVTAPQQIVVEQPQVIIEQQPVIVEQPQIVTQGTISLPTSQTVISSPRIPTTFRSSGLGLRPSTTPIVQAVQMVQTLQVAHVPSKPQPQPKPPATFKKPLLPKPTTQLIPALSPVRSAVQLRPTTPKVLPSSIPTTDHPHPRHIRTNSILSRNQQVQKQQKRLNVQQANLIQHMHLQSPQIEKKVITQKENIQKVVSPVLEKNKEATQKIKIEEFKLPVKQEEIRRLTQQQHALEVQKKKDNIKITEQKATIKEPARLPIKEISQRLPIKSTTAGTQKVTETTVTKQVIKGSDVKPSASGFNFSVSKNFVNTSNEITTKQTVTTPAQQPKEVNHATAFAFFKNEQANKTVTPQTAITTGKQTPPQAQQQQQQTISGGHYISHGLPFFTGKLPPGVIQTPYLPAQQQRVIPPPRVPSEHIVNAPIQKQANSVQTLKQARSLNIVNTSQQQTVTQVTQVTQQSTVKANTNLINEYAELKKKMEDIQEKNIQKAKFWQEEQTEKDIEQWNAAREVELGKQQGGFGHPMAVRTDVPLERTNTLTPPSTPPPAPAANLLDFAHEQALEILSFPMIEIIEYMPEKGVQFPDPADEEYEVHQEHHQQTIEYRQIHETMNYNEPAHAAQQIQPPAPALFSSFQQQQQIEYHSQNDNQQQIDYSPDDLESGPYQKVQYQQFKQQPESPPQQPQAFGEVYNTVEYEPEQNVEYNYHQNNYQQGNYQQDNYQQDNYQGEQRQDQYQPQHREDEVEYMIDQYQEKEINEEMKYTFGYPRSPDKKQEEEVEVNLENARRVDSNDSPSNVGRQRSEVISRMKMQESHEDEQGGVVQVDYERVEKKRESSRLTPSHKEIYEEAKKMINKPSPKAEQKHEKADNNDGQDYAKYLEKFMSMKNAETKPATSEFKAQTKIETKAQANPILVVNKETPTKVDTDPFEFKADIDYLRKKYGIAENASSRDEGYKVDLSKYETKYESKYDYRYDSAYPEPISSNGYIKQVEKYNVETYGSGTGGYGTGSYTNKYTSENKYSSYASGKDEIDEIIARYKGTSSSSRREPFESTNKHSNRYKANPPIDDEPIIVFTDATFSKKSSSRMRTYSSKPASTNISYDDLRARLFSDEPESKRLKY